jgi:hypothetical protein
MAAVRHQGLLTNIKEFRKARTEKRARGVVSNTEFVIKKKLT